MHTYDTLGSRVVGDMDRENVALHLRGADRLASELRLDAAASE